MQVTIAIHNQGRLFDPETLPHIFEPLQRGVAEIDKLGRSVGLGLYIVNAIVTAHHGSVEVQSNETDGTTFTVRLPKR